MKTGGGGELMDQYVRDEDGKQVEDFLCNKVDEDFSMSIKSVIKLFFALEIA